MSTRGMLADALVEAIWPFGGWAIESRHEKVVTPPSKDVILT